MNERINGKREKTHHHQAYLEISQKSDGGGGVDLLLLLLFGSVACVWGIKNWNCNNKMRKQAHKMVV